MVNFFKIFFIPLQFDFIIFNFINLSEKIEAIKNSLTLKGEMLWLKLLPF